jgi:hypothetical protein
MPHPLREPDPDFLDHTIEVFQPRTPRKLTREDAREITTNMVAFFRILMEWDQKDRARDASAGGDHG